MISKDRPTPQTRLVTLPCEIYYSKVDINISQGAVANCLRCGGIFNVHSHAYFNQSVPANEFCKSVIF